MIDQHHFSNAAMISTYVISLPDELTRRTSIMQQCRRFSIEPKIIDAVDMRQASSEQIQELSAIPSFKKISKQRWLSKGELGCALSHLKAYKQIIEHNEKYAFIVEDDAYFIRNPSILLHIENLEKVSNQYPFDILILGYVKTLEPQLPYYYRRIPIKKRAILQQKDEEIIFGTPWEQYACGTVAYIIHQKAARSILQFNQKPCVTADDWLCFTQYCDLQVLHARPTFVLEDLENFASTIRQEKNNFLQPKRSSIMIRSIKGYAKNFAMNYLNFK